MTTDPDFHSPNWRAQVTDLIRQAKARPFGAIRLYPKSRNQEIILSPVTVDVAEDFKLIEALTQWRDENIRGFAKWFRPTVEGTRSWVWSQLVQRPDRILFLIVDSKEQWLGHVGLSSFDFDAGTCEIDNVVRGIADAPRGLMASAVAAIMGWAYEELGVREIRLRTFTDNTRALALYHRVGFRPLALLPLRKVEQGDTTEWVEADDGQGFDRFYLLMGHTRPKPIEGVHK